MPLAELRERREKLNTKVTKDHEAHGEQQATDGACPVLKNVYTVMVVRLIMRRAGIRALEC